MILRQNIDNYGHLLLLITFDPSEPIEQLSDL